MKNFVANRVSLRTLASLVVVSIFSLGYSTPASANSSIILSLNGVTLTSGTLPTSPILIPVPSDNVIDSGDAVRVAVSGLAANTVVAVTANNAFIVASPSTSLSPVKSTDGVASSSSNVGTGSNMEFYVFTKTSALSSFTVSILGNTSTYYLKGIPGPAYNLTATIPSPGFVSSFSKVSIRVTDVFGNAVSNVVPSISVINLTASTPLATNSEGVTESTITYPGIPGQSAVGLSISATDVIGLPTAKKSISSFIDVKDLVAELAAERTLRAQDKLELEKKASDAQTALANALALKSSSESALTALQNSYNQYKSEVDKKLLLLEAQVSQLKKSLAQEVNRYELLVKKYNVLAKKYKQPIIRG